MNSRVYRREFERLCTLYATCLIDFDELMEGLKALNKERGV